MITFQNALFCIQSYKNVPKIMSHTQAPFKGWAGNDSLPVTLLPHGLRSCAEALLAPDSAVPNEET